MKPHRVIHPLKDPQVLRFYSSLKTLGVCSMSDHVEATIERCLQRWRPTLQPATFQSKGYSLRRFAAYPREYHPKVMRSQSAVTERIAPRNGPGSSRSVLMPG